jgi:hypothetical protein
MSSQALIPVIAVSLVLSVLLGIILSFTVYSKVKKFIETLSSSVKYAATGGLTVGFLYCVYYVFTIGKEVVENNWMLGGYAILGYIGLAVLGYAIDKIALARLNEFDKRFKSKSHKL